MRNTTGAGRTAYRPPVEKWTNVTDSSAMMRLKCRLCPRTYKRKAELLRHIQEQHDVYKDTEFSAAAAAATDLTTGGQAGSPPSPSVQRGVYARLASERRADSSGSSARPPPPLPPGLQTESAPLPQGVVNWMRVMSRQMRLLREDVAASAQRDLDSAKRRIAETNEREKRLRQALAELEADRDKAQQEQGHAEGILARLKAESEPDPEEELKRGLREGGQETAFMLESDFCKRECGQAALLTREKGYLQRMGVEMFDITRGYADMVRKLGDFDDRPALLVEIANRDGDMERTIREDCVRTFACDDHRARLEKFLYGSYIDFGNYSQAMAHVAAMLMITESEDNVMLILRKINSQYIPGHWEHQAIGFSINAYVFRHVCNDLHPDAIAHLDRLLVSPDMYCRKWFSQLFLHALDIEHWYVFFEAFLSHGFAYLLACGLSVMTHLKDKVMGTTDIITLLRLFALSEVGITSDDGRRMINGAMEHLHSVKVKLGSEEDLSKLREELYDKHLKARMEEAARQDEMGEDDQEHVEDCPFTGKPCGKKAKFEITNEGHELEGALLCPDCAACAEEKGLKYADW